jgi:serine/threonine-protein kinase
VADDGLRTRLVAAVDGHYAVEAEVGRGGMAVVYRATDVRLRRKVALKVLPPELAFREEVKRRFLREAEMAAGLAHPHIVPIYSVDERDGLVWMAMGLVDGESLAERLHREPRPPVDVVRRVLREVCEALEYAHREGVVHRDIKPDNILLERGTGRALVTDFGIARAAEGDQRLTATGIAVGTPAYMSPEQAMGEREVDGRADLYALGIVGYQMLAGELPFQASNTPTMLMKHLSERPRPLRDVRADLPGNLIYAIDRALAKSRDERWPNAAEFRAALAEDAESPSAKRRSGAVARASAGVPAPRASSGSGMPLAGGVAAASTSGEPLDDLRQRTPVPGPEFPKLPRDWMRDATARTEGREALRQWREEARRWREEVRNQPRPQREELRVAAQRMGEFVLQQKTPDERIAGVRKRIGAGVVTIGMLALINAITSPQFPWVIFPAIGIGYGVVRRITDLWADGIPVREIFRRPAPRVRGDETPLRRLDPKLPAPAAPNAAQAVLDAVPKDVLDGRYGPAVREAFETRAKIRSLLARLPEHERAMLPEIEPTVEALVERVRTLAIALHALDADASPDALVRLETRIAQAEAMPEGPERERRLELLARQRHTLTDLAERRGALKTQLEQAALVLETMQLDLTRLRSSGVAARVADEGPHTQELNALVRDVERVAEAVDESRLDRGAGE